MTKSVIVAVVKLERSENALEDGKDGRVAGKRTRSARHHASNERAKDVRSRPISQTGNLRRSHNPYHAAAPKRVEVETARVQIGGGGEIRPGGRAGAREGGEQSTVLIEYSLRRVQPGDA